MGNFPQVNIFKKTQIPNMNNLFAYTYQTIKKTQMKGDNLFTFKFSSEIEVCQLTN